MVPKSIHIKSCLVREVGEERGGLGLIVELLGPQGWGRRDETAGRRQMHSASSSGSSGGKEGVSSQSYFEFAE